MNILNKVKIGGVIMNYICIVCDGKEVCITSKETAESIQDSITSATRKIFIKDWSYGKERRILIDTAKVSIVMDVTKEVNRMNAVSKS